MSSEPESVRCPRCGTVLPVSPEWRFVQCPQCGFPIMQMSSDSRYDGYEPKKEPADRGTLFCGERW